MLKKYIKNNLLRSILEWIIQLAIVIALSFLIQMFIISIANVNNISMEPTFQHGDRLLINKFIYRLTKPKSGDIIVFPYREDPSQLFVKRIIGIPGDEIDLRDYQFTVNGVFLDDDFSDELIYALGNISFPLTVPEGTYFVLGDNRNGSKDSRYYEVGCIPANQMIGKVFMRIWPINGFKLY